MSDLTREQFEKDVLARDKGKCIFCGGLATEAHHIIDRKLFPDRGGYFLNNGASVCNDDHWKCETTEYTVELVREKVGITEIVLPPGCDPSLTYDKWLNVLLPDGRRLKGPLFEDTAVQKLLKRDLWRYE